MSLAVKKETMKHPVSRNTFRKNRIIMAEKIEKHAQCLLSGVLIFSICVCYCNRSFCWYSWMHLTQSLLIMKNCFSIHTDQSICLFHRSSIFQNQIWVWHMLSMILINFMTAIAQKQGIVEEKQQKINENAARVCYKRISNCSIRRANLFTD